MSPGRRVLAWLLVAAMALGSITVWLLSPIGWLLLASRLQSSSQPSMGPYVLVIVGIVATSILVATLLSRANRAHLRLMGTEAERRRSPWLKSMRAERHTVSDNGVLDRVMLISVSIAMTCSAIWFFAFAGSSLPK